MKFEPTNIPEVIIVLPKKFSDTRGYFMETFRADLFEAEAGPFAFVQDNRSLSIEAGTVRGLHFQSDPRAQGKLVSCIAGALLDVAVDIREGSATYGKHVAIELSPENGIQLWIPPGFAHGFCTLKPNTMISYRVTDYYSAEHDRGLLWNDPELGIDWPVSAENAHLSEKDQKQPSLTNLKANFGNPRNLR
jgi:dTDP-4-dehydrorhamnose 3,5-epimerase